MATPRDVWAKLWPALAAVAGVAAAGTLALHAAFGGGLGVNLYRALTTMATLGDQRLVPRTPVQYAVLGGLALLGYAGWGVVVAVVAGTLVSLDLGALWEGRRMEARIARLSGHTVVVGGGRVGTHLAEEMARRGGAVVVIERDPHRARLLEEGGRCLVLALDALEDGVLERAGVARAGGVALALPEDAQNLYAYLAVRELAPHVPVVARAESVRAERQLRHLGVERIVMPTRLGGLRMARLLAQPLVADFLDQVVDDARLEVREIDVDAGMPWAGRTVGEVAAAEGGGSTVLCIRRGERLLALPTVGVPVLAGDTLLIATARDEGAGEG
ncbi:MAG: TrkA family potassium uptake protein [Firmicutes bacterium]|nr:TrkA family potassium uptake protein [Bacillota bacterium]